MLEVVGRYRGSSPLAGTGSPEGVVAAPVGTSYADRAGTRGAAEWVKISGTGTTGWQVTHGDTGWRNLDSIVDMSKFSTVNSPSFRVRRVRDVVFLSVIDLSAIANLPASTPFFQMPAGFRHSGSNYAPLLGLNINTFGLAPLRIGASYHSVPYAVMNAGLWSGTVRFALEAAYHCPEPWPTVLPGTAA